MPRLASLNFAAHQFDVVQRLRDRIPEGLRPAVSKILFRRGRALKMDPEDRRYLVHYYRDDIRKLASLLNRDLSAWLV